MGVSENEARNEQDTSLRRVPSFVSRQEFLFVKTETPAGDKLMSSDDDNGRSPPQQRDLSQALEYSAEWLSIIAQAASQGPDSLPNAALAEKISRESRRNFADHFNAGWLEYRKSATMPGTEDAMVCEWSGRGALFRDVSGREFIDCLGGYGLFSLGWSNPVVTEAVRNQLARTPMPSQELIDPLRGVLARLVALVCPGDISCAFFCASGTEAVEGAIKLAKMYTQKPAFICAVKAFHGKTMGSLSMIGKKDFRTPPGQLYGGPVYHVPFGDAEAVEKQLQICEDVGVGVAAVLMEPIQGEAGAIVPPDDFWPRIRAATKKHGVLLIADEVQTGLGRTGTLLGVDHWGVEPDIITFGKAFGGGVMPVSCFASTPEIWKVMQNPNPFIHTTTTGGGALACAAAIASLNVTLKERTWEQARDHGNFLMPRLEELARRYPDLLSRVTGKGLLIGLHFHDGDRGYEVAAALFRRNILVAGTLTNAQTIRIEPPLVITREQLSTVLEKLNEALEEVSTKTSNDDAPPPKANL
jgi:putrescine aminotransferase